ncbi:hypothetical protein Pla123a_10660 [Posidoniimonas polymericola]|uniref:Uncharacterized protein n=1 Tax=Posidoniimonas polymericola TaxID=2528002 RepID=A0A5C5YTI0_9BACT|nr:hypothetical protein [Posidoniimonas polymericola]TWT78275.1 hypothetical protein Pla123a_10660 [Posidoniimonas polymericola]
MTWLIGVDEAGYGPNLGPLAVAATAWRVPDGVADLYELLAEVVCQKPNQTRIAIADSKLLYKPGGGLGTLERALFAALNPTPTSYAVLLAQLAADPAGRRAPLPWHDGFDPALPCHLNPADQAAAEVQWSAGCGAAGVPSPNVRARLVFPEEFNELTEEHGTKGAALSHVTIGMLAGLLADLAPEGPVECVLDKHGGRNRYAALLQHHFPDHLIETHHESRPESRYACSTDAGRWTFAFRSKGESFLPAALASMTAKYLRELSMQALNDYWARHVEDLKPTAGYPVDAKRYRADIEHARVKQQVSERVLWRNR